MSTKHIFLIAGEPSGDEHGAKLINAIKQHHSNVRFSGMGGEHMHQAGMDIIVDSSDMAVVGFYEILKIIKKIRHAFKVVKQHIATHKPDMVILIDYPGFNLRMAKFAKKHNCKVLYYISPQLWAWRQGRVKIIQQCVDQMAVVLPFEVDFYRQHQVDAKYVGHPLLSDFDNIHTKQQARTKYFLDSERLIIGLCPGSRRSELQHLVPILLQTASKLRLKYPNCLFAVPQAPNLEDALYAELGDDVIKTRNDFYDTISLCDVVISASGTATLQIALTKTPMIIIYKSSWISVSIARFLVKAPLIGLCNLIAGKKIVQEMIQNDVTPENLCSEITQIIENETYRHEMIAELGTVCDHLESPNQTSIGQLAVDTLITPDKIN